MASVKRIRKTIVVAAATLPTIPKIIEKVYDNIRNEQVVTDTYLASLYGITKDELQIAVKKYASLFPPSAMFQLTREESICLMKKQVEITLENRLILRELLNEVEGYERYLPYVFNRHGINNLPTALKSNAEKKYPDFEIKLIPPICFDLKKGYSALLQQRVDLSGTINGIVGFLKEANYCNGNEKNCLEFLESFDNHYRYFETYGTQSTASIQAHFITFNAQDQKQFLMVKSFDHLVKKEYSSKRMSSEMLNESCEYIEDLYKLFTSQKDVESNLTVADNRLNENVSIHFGTGPCKIDDNLDAINTTLGTPESVLNGHQQFKAPLVAMFCQLVEHCQIINKPFDESAASFCQKVCERFKITYTDNVRKNYKPSIDVKKTNKHLKNVIKLLLPNIPQKEKDAIDQYINNQTTTFN